MTRLSQSWTLVQELEYFREAMRRNQPMTPTDKDVLQNLVAGECAALAREAGALRRSAGLPHLHLVKP